MQATHMSDQLPRGIVVVGGGRWARVLIDVLCSLVPSSLRLAAYSKTNSRAMKDWVLQKGLTGRVEVFSRLPVAGSRGKSAVIVANAAADHEATARWALSNGYPVLVEKPFCLGFSAANQIVNLANTQRIYLAAGHVFLFASYIQQFSKLISEQEKILSIYMQWEDIASESRYGEVKSYDSSLPIYADCLPHLLSILHNFGIGSASKLSEVECFKGGSHIKIHLSYGDIPCFIELARNGFSRRRVIEVKAPNKNIELDFSSEPGFIKINSKLIPANLSWEENPRPLAGMLMAFMRAAAGGIRDPRLDASIGVEVTKVMDQVAPLYREALMDWFEIEFYKNANEINGDLRYALNEILAVQDGLNTISSECKINRIYELIKEDFVFPGKYLDGRFSQIINAAVRKINLIYKK